MVLCPRCSPLAALRKLFKNCEELFFPRSNNAKPIALASARIETVTRSLPSRFDVRAGCGCLFFLHASRALHGRPAVQGEPASLDCIRWQTIDVPNVESGASARNRHRRTGLGWYRL